MKNLTGKVAALGTVLIAVLVALWFVSAIVSEREGRMREAQSSVADGLSGSQMLVGPALRRSCEETWTAQEGEAKERKTVKNKRIFELRSLPKSLDVTAQAGTSQRTRGIFKVNTFDLSSTTTAGWLDLDGMVPVSEHEGGRVHCEAIQVAVAVGDARGIRSVLFTVNGKSLEVLPGTGLTKFTQGFHAQLPLTDSQLAQSLQIKLQLDLVGTGELLFAPVGDKTTVTLSSNWQHPSFGGRFLPNSREVDANGFRATWQLSAIASSARQQFLAGAGLCGFGEASRGDGCVETMGLNFMEPMSVYTLSDRATKYGLLFVVLTFVGVGLVEIMNRLRVHPIQYLLVGSALCLFFLLLVSLSEHMSFGRSYILASAACSVLLGFYGSFVLRGVKAGIVFGGAVGALYGTLYVLLQQEQTALLLGSMLLFVVLAIIMFITRRIDWYER